MGRCEPETREIDIEFEIGVSSLSDLRTPVEAPLSRIVEASSSSKPVLKQSLTPSSLRRIRPCPQDSHTSSLRPCRFLGPSRQDLPGAT